MKNLLLIFILSVAQNVYSQENKDEIQDWIREKTSKYYYLNDGSSPKRFLNFRDGILIYGISNYDNLGKNISTTLRKIKVSEIKTVEIKKIYIDRDVWIINLYCAQDKNCVAERREYHFNKTYEEDVANSISMEYNEKFSEEDLANRMSKALNDLIKAYGGTAIINVKKEKY